MAPLFSILHPSARPHKWREIYDAWIKAAAHPENVEYVLCADERWGFVTLEEFNYQMVGGRTGLDKTVFNRARRCYVDSVNIAAKSSTGRILIVIADDQYPCQHWDRNLGSAIARGHHEYIIEVSTGTPNEHNRGMIVMPILSRERYERLGYVFYPRYESMYADNDFYEHAKLDDCIVDARELIFPHHHPVVTHGAGSPRPEDPNYWDEAYREQNRAESYALGERVIEWRRRIQFGLRIEEADKIPGWMTPEELEALSFWASQQDSVTEIGTYVGRTTYALASGCPGTVRTIDNIDLDRNALDPLRPFHNLTIDIGDSSELAKTLPDTDMVFIDGGHSYEQVKADLEAWAHKTKKLICGHDYCEADAPGVVRAVREKFGDAVQLGPGRLWSWNGEKPVRLEKDKRRNIAIALPGENFSGIWVAKLLQILFNIQRTWNFCTIINYTSSAGITRQTICQQIGKMAPDFVPDFILWIDDDQIVESGIVDMLLADADAVPDADLIAGWTWIASSGAHHNEPQVSCGRMNLERGEISHAEHKSVQSADGIFEVHWTGFPIVLMRYSALAKVGKHPFAHYPCAESPWGECGEDISFCKRLRDAGGKIMVDSRAFVPHLKQKALGPSPDSKDQIALALSGRTSPSTNPTTVYIPKPSEEDELNRLSGRTPPKRTPAITENGKLSPLMMNEKFDESFAEEF